MVIEATSGRVQTVLLPAALVSATTVIAYAAWSSGTASAVEAVAFITGVICVWLVVRQNIWNFPLGLLNVAAYAWVFYDYRLYADAGLQIVYFVLNAAGWYLWLHGGKDRTALQAGRTSRRELILIALFIPAATAFLFWLLGKLGGAAKFWDALTTSVSLSAQWLQSRKKLECWHLWILADVIYVPLYISRGLNLTALLYGVFLCMAVMGLLAWQKSVTAWTRVDLFE